MTNRGQFKKWMRKQKWTTICVALAIGFLAGLAFSGCRSGSASPITATTDTSTPPKAQTLRPGTEVPRFGDEIIAAGRRFRIGTPVVLWTDPGGYDAYRVEQRFVPYEQASWKETIKKMKRPVRYGVRFDETLPPAELERVRGGGWTLEQLQQRIDQFVLHYDVCGTSKQCFKILQDHRGLSVHFMLDVDGTLYQTLDLKERAFHASHANDRSIGIEIANIGAYPPSKASTFEKWYERDAEGNVRNIFPNWMGDTGIRTPGYVPQPRFNTPLRGKIHGYELVQYDYTAEQYEALAKLIAGLNRIFPKIAIDAPRDAQGNVRMNLLSMQEQNAFDGVLGHYHLTTNKSDPGPALDWEYLLAEAKRHAAQ